MLFLNHFQTRRDEDEWMDLPTTSRQDFTEALHDIQWVNRNLGGTAVILSELAQFIPTSFSGVFSILDLGTGSADIPQAIMDWVRQVFPAQEIQFKITAVDIHTVAVDVAKQLAQSYPEIEVIQADALNLDFPDESFDVVISSMFMHHLTGEQPVRLLQEMARLCRQGFIVNDLERHPLAWLGIKTLGVLQGKGKVFRNDAPLSVLRGFTRQELLSLKESAGLPALEIHHRKPYRWCLCWKREMIDPPVVSQPPLTGTFFNQ